MLIDARRIDDGASLCADVCIVGGGAAGITTALELGKAGVSVLLLESGGERPDAVTRDCIRGENAGLDYAFADGCRARFLGGASNYWGGWCRPLDRWDFESRGWVANSGWPFTFEAIEAHYRRSHEYLQLGPYDYDIARWVEAAGRDDIRRIPLPSGRVLDSLSQFSAPTRFGRHYRRALATHDAIKVVLNATVLELETDQSGGTVVQARARTQHGKTLTARARFFVVACGGIDNARLLLLSNRARPCGLGNEYDRVGRYFMEHPRLFSADVRLKRGWARNRLYDYKFHHNKAAVQAFGTRFAAAFTLSRATQEQEQITNSRVWLCSMFAGDDTPTADALIRTKHRLEQRESPDGSAVSDLGRILMHPLETIGFVAGTYLQPRWMIQRTRMQAIVEPEPDPNSRVTLAETKDAFGQPRARVSWHLTATVRRTFDRSFALVAEELRQAGVAEVTLDPPLADQETWPKTPDGTWHHMGTTRMHVSPRHGVVDADALVHGMSNLFMAGSSVFPTAGANFPTQLIVALSLRLADHIAARLRAHDQPELAEAM